MKADSWDGGLILEVTALSGMTEKDHLKTSAVN
jgi:hypothetical protein